MRYLSFYFENWWRKLSWIQLGLSKKTTISSSFLLVKGPFIWQIFNLNCHFCEIGWSLLFILFIRKVFFFSWTPNKFSKYFWILRTRKIIFEKTYIPPVVHANNLMLIKIIPVFHLHFKMKTNINSFTLILIIFHRIIKWSTTPVRKGVQGRHEPRKMFSKPPYSQ